MDILGFVAGPYQTNCYLFDDGAKLSVIDPGMQAQPVVEQYLREHNRTLEHVVLTHGHIDHTRDAAALANAWDVPLWIHPDDAFMLEAGDGVLEQSKVLFQAHTMPQAKDLRYLEHGQTIELGGEAFEVRHAPGHSPGSVLFVGKQLCISGDVVFQGSIGRTDLPQSDPEAMEQSLRDEVLRLDPALQILPGHGAATTARAEFATNPFLTSLK
ncbi:MBL fold metallo-hydrolase [Corynebacterium pseudopelargi]|uniref:MBL fold metallo-hydrolase n=1 Tax=Corynebacterium pseudopelargi TaxID=2080757 RepID=UPI000F4E74EE|nr:MBL fold metallo-hydrolase [Corynebacterium pseudopelargi]